MYPRQSEQLGAIPLVPIALSFLGGVVKADKDPMRLQVNAAAEAAARQGDPEAALFLHQRSGRLGPGPFTGPYGALSGETRYGSWATTKAKNDAFAKYQGVVAIVAAPPPGVAPVAGPGVPMPKEPGVLGGALPILLIGAALFAFGRKRKR